MAVTDIFDFALAKNPLPEEKYVPGQRRINASRTGKKFILVRADVLEFRAKVAVAYPQPTDSGRTVEDVIDFIDTHKAEEFRYMPFTGPSLRREVTTYAAGVSDTDFAFDHKHLYAASVEVYKDGVLVDPADYTLVDNDTAPLIRFTVAPGVSTIRIEANFLIPVVFLKTPGTNAKVITDRKRGALTDDAPVSWVFELVETEPGARFVNATGKTGA